MLILEVLTLLVALALLVASRTVVESCVQCLKNAFNPTAVAPSTAVRASPKAVRASPKANTPSYVARPKQQVLPAGRKELTYMEKVYKYNNEWMKAMLQSLNVKRVSSVHFAFVDPETGLVGVGYEQNKDAFDWLGGTNEYRESTLVKQTLATAAHELYEEGGIKIKMPFSQFVLEIIACGSTCENLLFVVALKGIPASQIKALMQSRQTMQLPYCYYEMDGFEMYPATARIKGVSTSYVRQQIDKVVAIAKQHRGTVPNFDDVMVLGHTGVMQRT